jgi:5'-deoxynucleotidase
MQSEFPTCHDLCFQHLKLLHLPNGHNRHIQNAYKDLERSAAEKMVEMLPQEMQEALTPCILADEESEEYKLVKAADRLSAYIKCLEELRSGNTEFSKAKKSIEEDLLTRGMPEVEYFFQHFIPSFHLALDELKDLSDD